MISKKVLRISADFRKDAQRLFQNMQAGKTIFERTVKICE